MPRSEWRLTHIQPFSGWRLRFAGKLRKSSEARKVGSPDLHQARMRFLVLAGCVVYGALIGAFDAALTEAQTLIFEIGAVLFGLFALYTHTYFKRNPKPDFPRRTIGLFADHAAACACLAITGRDAVALAWLPLFIIQGVGIRFGVRWLFASQAIGVVSVGLICWLNPFFRENATVALGAVLSVLVLPLYFVLLAKREARIKAALEAARLEAEEANAAKGRFVAMISHELRTPLTGISGLNELLRKQNLPPQTKQMLAEQGAATSLMLTMVNDVLDLAKIEEGAMQLQAVDFDPQRLALTVLQALSFQATQKGLSVHIELDSSLPTLLSGSPFHVTRILQNLIGNAIKFTSDGSITLRVFPGDHSELRKKVCSVRFEVVDTGIGIPESALPRIFDRFYQVDAAVTRRFGGTGLGTSLVKEFCDLLGGSVEIRSRLGEGTCCVVTLPFGPPQEVVGAAVADVSGLTVAACSEGIADWANVESVLTAAGAVVYDVAARHEARWDPATPKEFPDVLLLADRISSEAAAALDAMELGDPGLVVLRDGSQRELMGRAASSRVVVGARSGTLLARAVQLAALGTPFRHADAVEPHPSTPEHDSTAPGAWRVLVAEDTPTIQLFMRVTLENAGFAVTVASDGAEALREAGAGQYDVVVLDWNMPKVDGIAVLRSIRNAGGPNAATAIVMATAAPSQQLINEAVSAGAQAVLGKPFEGEELVHAVQGVLACGAGIPTAGGISSLLQRDQTGRDASQILDFDALESPGSIFRIVDPAELMSTFQRDVERIKPILTQAAATRDLVQFRASVHSLAGYAGSLGARRLEWLLAAAPRDDEDLATRGVASALELCETIDNTARGLAEWARTLTCAVD